MRSRKSSNAKATKHARRKPSLGASDVQSSGKRDRSTTASPWTLRTHSASDTERLGVLTGRAALGGELLALSGELGSGKTCFVRGLAAGLGAARLAVTSPTFVFIHEYVGRLRLAHADLFRLEGVPAYYELGLTDYLNERTIVAIEWPEKAECELPMDRLVIQLSHKGKNVRELRFQSHGAISLAFLARLRKLRHFPIVATSRNVRSEVRLKRSRKESAHTPASIRRSAHK